MHDPREALLGDLVAGQVQHFSVCIRAHVGQKHFKPLIRNHIFHQLYHAEPELPTLEVLANMWNQNVANFKSYQL